MASEFSLINQFFKPLSHDSLLSSVEVSIGDDGAIVNCPENKQLVVVTDTLIEGVHFPEITSPYDIAWKALAVNLSDLAAMGAAPAFYSLALSLPEKNNHSIWLTEFSKGLETLAASFSIPLIGGDMTRHEKLVVTVTAHGWIEKNQAILRSGAKLGDLIFVTGEIGNGGLALNYLQKGLPVSDKLLSALNTPTPKVAIGRQIKDFATSAIDISDGFLADLNHILNASDAGASINYAAMPFSDELKTYLQQTKDWLFPLTCGDDYQLCFTIPENLADNLKGILKSQGLQVTQVGKVVEKSKGIQLENTPEEIDLNDVNFGYLHYS